MEENKTWGVELSKALCSAQGEIATAIKSKENSFFSKPNKKSMYADLSDDIDVIKPVANKYGLSVTFNYKSTLENDGRLYNWMRYTIRHTSGEYEISDWFILLMKDDNQHGFGGSNTYYRRQILKAIYQIPEEDDDGNSQSIDYGRKETKPALKNYAPQAKELLTKEDVVKIYALARSKGFNDSFIEEKIKTISNAQELSKISVKYEKVILAYFNNNKPDELT